jgi:hypothetical protein
MLDVNCPWTLTQARASQEEIGAIFYFPICEPAHIYWRARCASNSGEGLNVGARARILALAGLLTEF